MGAGIAQLAAQSGISVLLYDLKDDYVQRGLSDIRSALQTRVDKGKLDPSDMHATLHRIPTTTNRDDAASYDLIIEAAPEDIALKREIFAVLERAKRARHHPRHQHLLPLGHFNRLGRPAPGACGRHALLQPRARHAPRRNDSGAARLRPTS